MVKVLRNYGDLVIINSFASEHQEPWFMMGRGYMLHPMQVQDYCTRASRFGLCQLPNADGPSELTNRADGVSVVPLQTRARNQFNDVFHLMVCARIIIPSGFLFIRLGSSRDLPGSSSIDFPLSCHIQAPAKTSTST
jgi:hypothetical protein